MIRLGFVGSVLLLVQAADPWQAILGMVWIVGLALIFAGLVRLQDWIERL